MASGSVSVRLSDEVLERLALRAKVEGKKVSDVVRELIEAGLKSTGSVDSKGVVERIDELEGTIRALLGTEDTTVMSRVDAVNADFWQANEILLSFLTSAISTAAEGRYFARLAAMYGMDVAHYVAQKAEAGVMPKPPDKEEKKKQLVFHEKEARKYAGEVLGKTAQKE